MIGVNMNVLKNIISKGWYYQALIEDRFRHIPSLSFDTYLFFMSFVFLISGFMLSVYSLVFNINPWLCQPLSCCFFYFVLGFVLFFVWIGSKRLKKVVDGFS
jgi:uncharacterized membrane protein SirB2